MAPSFVTMGATALACAGHVAANKWFISDIYDHANFFNKFDFFVSNYATGDVDLSKGYVNYLSQEDASAKNLASIQGSEIFLGVDNQTVIEGADQPGRSSTRIESKAVYNHGLFIAHFTHLPENKCGVWPAFWSYGPNWPNNGEIDMYENWNDATLNQQTMHTGDSAVYGGCALDSSDQISPVVTDNCDNKYQNPPTQVLTQGCSSNDPTGAWASPEGGFYAMEWTSDFIKLYSWTVDKAPANIASDEPDTSAWGKPSVYLRNQNCDIDRHFANQKLVLNIDFCGQAAGIDPVWKKSCAAKTSSPTCSGYVASHPEDFSEVYFKIKDIRYFDSSPSKAMATSTAPSTPSNSAVAENVALPSTVCPAGAGAACSSNDKAIMDLNNTIFAPSRLSSQNKPCQGTNCPVGSGSMKEGVSTLALVFGLVAALI